MWRHQLIIGFILLFLAIPVYFLDQFLLKPGTGNWISLDFRGLFVWTYLILIGLHLLLSSIAIHFYQKEGLLKIQLVSFLS